MDDCCRNLQPRPVQKQTGRCHSCNQRGKPVAHETVEALIKPEFRDTVDGRVYGFCDTPTCSTDKPIDRQLRNRKSASAPGERVGTFNAV